MAELGFKPQSLDLGGTVLNHSASLPARPTTQNIHFSQGFRSFLESVVLHLG